MKMGLRRAADEKCKQCIYDPYDKGTWRQQVEECCESTCALWEHRPKTIKTKLDKDEDLQEVAA